MFVGTLTLELFLSEAASLKDKRKIIKSITERIKARYNVSVSEVDGHDTWQRSVIGVSVVSREQAQARRVLEAVARSVESDGRAEVTAVHTEVL